MFLVPPAPEPCFRKVSLERKIRFIYPCFLEAAQQKKKGKYLYAGCKLREGLNYKTRINVHNKLVSCIVVRDCVKVILTHRE